MKTKKAGKAATSWLQWKELRRTPSHDDILRAAKAQLKRMHLTKQVRALFCFYEGHTPGDVVVLRWPCVPKVKRPAVTANGRFRDAYMADESYKRRVCEQLDQLRAERTKGFAALSKLFAKRKTVVHEVHDEEIVLWPRGPRG